MLAEWLELKAVVGAVQVAEREALGGDDRVEAELPVPILQRSSNVFSRAMPMVMENSARRKPARAWRNASMRWTRTMTVSSIEPRSSRASKVAYQVRLAVADQAVVATVVARETRKGSQRR